MNIPEISVNLKCLFCNSPVEKLKVKGTMLNSGDLFKCSQCGESNDYDSVLEVAKAEAKTMIKSSIHEVLKKQFKGK
ncbi:MULTISPECIES: hypothetical protein [Pseudanabaena]|jgi:DNA-directed RNA polymerase subunit RPC12/RpoP|uniref:hypothetical protein n=1 Tax=Pseudanabaena TaxID=1152 RepID=UPI00247A7CE1|nr:MULTISPECIES: hypothetical protein [Pseudanabaena]MEA5489455.1 hypothetical protein [Pseudanabaena sp. CCNP1317]WGS71526.1 hypothetical protein OA858_17685 [Pseudanabaena galeata CCNP1313]